MYEAKSAYQHGINILKSGRYKYDIDVAKSKDYRLFSPGDWCKSNKDRIQFESAEEHAERENPFSTRGDPGIILCRTNTAETGAYVADGSDN